MGFSVGLVVGGLYDWTKDLEGVEWHGSTVQFMIERLEISLNGRGEARMGLV